MPIQILTTKLSIPAIRPRVVLRPRLLQKLNQGLECGFVLISAPAGYGKSTLLSTWLNRQEFPCTWLTLDDRDNDPSHFLTYLVTALQIIDSSIDPIFLLDAELASSRDVQPLLTPMINHLAGIKQPFCLVLDDYHVIQNQVIHQAVCFLLEHRPFSMHIVLATRADPPLPLSKLRAHSYMQEVRMNDLRFTDQESEDFLSHTMGLTVSQEDVANITKRTEGWIAGLQMAALSMQNADDVSGFIANLTGSHHYIFDYLLEEILGKQTAEIHRFLLYTSILEQLSAPLCDALLSGDEATVSTRPASVILEELEHANLFIVPLDHEQRWYRYHPLFAELLHGYLQKSNSSLLPVLHSRAIGWYEDQGLFPEAIRHSLISGDWERAVRLISTNIFALLEQNELTSLGRQLETLTKEANPARPWLLVGRAWLAAYTGQLSAVETILLQAESEINNLKSEIELQTLGGHIAAIRAYIYWIGNQREIAANAARAALEWLPEDERVIRCQAATLLGLNLYDFNDREQALKQALTYARECSVSHVTIFAHSCWAWLLTMEGKLREAHAACYEAIQLAQSGNSYQPLPTLSHVYTTLSGVLREWNDLEDAIRYSKEAVELAHRWGQADALHFALDTLGYALFAAGDIDGAFDAVQKSWQVARRTSPWFEEITIAQQVEWDIILGNLDGAVQHLHSIGIHSIEPETLTIETYKSPLLPLAFIQVLLAQKEYPRAIRLISRLIEEVEKKGIGHYLIRLLAWQALAYHGMRQDEQALSSLKRLIVLTEPEGYLRIFIQEGEPMVALLQRARSAGITPEYVDHLLAACDKRAKARPVQALVMPGLIEPLSVREMDVLKLLAEGCTDKKIAESLVIARETVHKHLKNIYGKLDVHSRTEAIARARELSLL